MHNITVTLDDETWDNIIELLYEERNKGNVQAQRAHSALRNQLKDKW